MSSHEVFRRWILTPDDRSTTLSRGAGSSQPTAWPQTAYDHLLALQTQTDTFGPHPGPDGGLELIRQDLATSSLSREAEAVTSAS
jgi:hypothetical protein